MNPQALKKEKTATRQRQARAQKPAKASAPMGKPQRVSSKEKPVQELREHIVEVISDSGEGAQRCGQSLASIAARMGNGIWTVEIIPAEIQPPARSIAGGSGNRVRLAAGRVTNGGDEADLVVAFNEQVLLGRVHAHELKPGCTILIENKWRNDDDAEIVAAYTRTIGQLEESGYVIQEIPMESECLKYVADPRRGTTTSKPSTDRSLCVIAGPPAAMYIVQSHGSISVTRWPSSFAAFTSRSVE